ncbi:hypothetical protein J132_01652, partial [Termitomyces sp. J132]
LILGATGAIGILLVRRALKVVEFCQVVLYVQSVEKIHNDLKSSPSITVIQSQLRDYVDVVLSALGPGVKKGPLHPPDIPLANAYLTVIDIMESEEVIAGYVRDGRTNTWLSRAGYAAFVIDEIGKRNWVKKAPLICSKMIAPPRT